jgi:hypothetical protein
MPVTIAVVRWEATGVLLLLTVYGVHLGGEG